MSSIVFLRLDVPDSARMSQHERDTDPMEIRTTDDLLTHWRSLQGMGWRDLARAAQVSRSTLDKIRSDEYVRPEKQAAVETALKMPEGSIRKFRETGQKPQIEFTNEEQRVTAPSLKRGEKLFEKTTEYGTRYRLETAEGYGASYTWATPRPYHEILPHLRSLCEIVATAGGLIE